VVKSKQIVFAVVILAIVIIAYFIFSHSEAEKVKMQFAFIAEKFTKESDENPIIAAANANKIKEVFKDHFKFQAPAYEIYREVSTDEIAPYVIAMRSQYAEISLKFYDFDVEFSSKDTANATVTQRMRAKLVAGEYIEDINELSCKLTKIDDKWLVTEIEVVAVLEK